MNNKLILIDGNSLLSSNFFGILDRAWHTGEAGKEKARQKMMKTPDGQPINAVYGMTKVLLKVLKEQSPSNLAIAWDVNRDTFRRLLYPDYKANREDTAPELVSQFPIMQDLVEKMGIAQFRFEGFEADDIIGSLSKKFEDTLPVYIMTKDQDALQLITNNTRVWLNTSTASDKAAAFYGESFSKESYNVPDKYFEFTNDTFPFFYEGLSPIQIIDLKAIEGDKSDNIPGVSGVGSKTIYPLLSEYFDVESIYDYIEDTDEKEAKEFFKELGIKKSPIGNLKKQKEVAFLSKQLATIKCDMEQFNDVTLEDLKVNVNTVLLNEKLKELNFKSLMS